MMPYYTATKEGRQFLSLRPTTGSFSLLPAEATRNRTGHYQSLEVKE